MEDTIKTLKGILIQLQYQSSVFDRTSLEHGSPDQTRAMLFESMFEQISGNIQIAVNQLKILQRELY